MFFSYYYHQILGDQEVYYTNRDIYSLNLDTADLTLAKKIDSTFLICQKMRFYGNFGTHSVISTSGYYNTEVGRFVYDLRDNIYYQDGTTLKGHFNYYQTCSWRFQNSKQFQTSDEEFGAQDLVVWKDGVILVSHRYFQDAGAVTVYDQRQFDRNKSPQTVVGAVPHCMVQFKDSNKYVFGRLNEAFYTESDASAVILKYSFELMVRNVWRSVDEDHVNLATGSTSDQVINSKVIEWDLIGNTTQTQFQCLQIWNYLIDGYTDPISSKNIVLGLYNYVYDYSDSDYTGLSFLPFFIYASGRSKEFAYEVEGEPTNKIMVPYFNSFNSISYMDLASLSVISISHAVISLFNALYFFVTSCNPLASSSNARYASVSMLFSFFNIGLILLISS